MTQTFKLAKKVDYGDIVVAEGHMGRTQRGEVCVWVDRFEIHVKSLAPPPGKHHGLSDAESRYRRRYVDMYANTTGGSHMRNMVCAMIKVMDDGIGNVTNALKAAGIFDDTVMIFSSDNGGPTNGNEGTSSNNFPLRGGKNTIWEGGTRVVGAIAGKGGCADGQVWVRTSSK